MRFAHRIMRHAIGSVTHVRTDETMAALTFDDGPDPIWTPRVLEVLERHGAQATFFMLGQRAAAHPELVAAVDSAGHCVANHGWSHRAVTRLSARERRREIRATHESLGPRAARMFRPPWGRMNVRARRDLSLLQFQPVLWNVDVGDWGSDDSAAMMAALRERIRPGCIVLLHDSIWDAGSRFTDRTPMLEALDKALARESEMRFVTLPELFSSGAPYRSLWFHDDEAKSHC